MPSSSSRSRAAIVSAVTVAVVLLWALTVTTGLAGLDFGYHWDERNMYLRSVANSIEAETLLPFQYYYPSLSYALALAVLVPDLVSARPADASAPADERLPAVRDPDLPFAENEGMAPAKRRALAAVWTKSYLLRLRAVFLLLSSLAVFWTALAVWRWRRSPLETVAAAAFTALPWEIAYHLRWVATDGLMMQFSALVLLFLTLSREGLGRGRWLLAAAVAAGLATGTKYPGGALLLAVGIAAWQAAGDEPRGRRWRRLALLGLAYAGAYLLSTPGTVLQPGIFLQHLAWVAGQYAGGHGGYTVGGFGAHLARIGEYLALAFFSPRAWLSLPVAALAVAGAVDLVRRERRRSAILLSFPLFYLLFIATQQVMMVRNLLILAPFLAVLAARGVGALWSPGWSRLERSAGRWAVRAAIAGFLAVYVIVGAGWLIEAADGIRRRAESPGLEQAAAVLRASAPGTIWVAPTLAADLAARGLAPEPAALAPDPASAERLMLWLKRDGFERWQSWPANRHRLFARQMAPYEVNLSYYPSWDGEDHVVLVERRRARRWGLIAHLEAGARQDGAGRRQLSSPP